MDSPDAIARAASCKRILVLGSSGSGKTTLSVRLASILDLPLIHLDAQFWKPGWVATSQDRWRAVVGTLIQDESWIIDGTYESTLDLRIPAAECIIIIDSPRWRCLWRVLKRRATIDDHARPDAPSGQKLNLAFLRYVWQYPTVTRPFVSECLRRYGSEKTIITLSSSSEIERFLDRMRLMSESNKTSVGV